MRICAERDTERTSQPKVSQLEIVALVDKQVLWFEITVKNPVGVAVQQT